MHSHKPNLSTAPHNQPSAADWVRRMAVYVPFLFLITLPLLGSCQPSYANATPTPTRTPILPTATPTHTPPPTETPTPTPTLTPSPTLPPGLILPPTPIKPEDWPALPADLYFLRKGRLWVWLAEGGKVESIPIVEDAPDTAVLDYRITSDKRYVAYVTTAGRLYLFDQAAWQHTYIPTAGHLLSGNGLYFDITSDQRYLIYAAWDVQPTTGAEDKQDGVAAPPRQDTNSTLATILALDLTDIRRQQINLGVCKGMGHRPCRGFMLSPDGSQIVYVDWQGIWRVPLAAPTPELLIEHEGEGLWIPTTLSEDNQWLLMTAGEALSNTFSLLNTSTREVFTPVNTTCPPYCHIQANLNRYTTWITTDSMEEGCLWRAEMGTSVDIAYQICQLDGWPLHPQSPYTLPDGWIAFVHRGCGSDCPGPAPGIYFVGPDNLSRAVALFDASEGSTLWAADGAAFLYLDEAQTARYIGLTDGSGFWDVQECLEDAHAFRWNEFIVPVP